MNGFGRRVVKKFMEFRGSLAILWGMVFVLTYMYLLNMKMTPAVATALRVTISAVSALACAVFTDTEVKVAKSSVWVRIVSAALVAIVVFVVTYFGLPSVIHHNVP